MDSSLFIRNQYINTSIFIGYDSISTFSESNIRKSGLTWLNIDRVYFSGHSWSIMKNEPLEKTALKNNKCLEN